MLLGLDSTAPAEPETEHFPFTVLTGIPRVTLSSLGQPVTWLPVHCCHLSQGQLRESAEHVEICAWRPPDSAVSALSPP